MFIFETETDRDRETMKAGKEQRKRETQKVRQAPGSELSAQSLTWGSKLTNREIVT